MAKFTIPRTRLFGFELIALIIASTPHSLTFIATAFASDRYNKDAYISYKTNDGRRFSISEGGWHLINQTNLVPKNGTFSTLTANLRSRLSMVTKFDNRYNYLFHPETIEGTTGDHVLITVAKPDGFITEETLQKNQAFYRKHWSKEKGYLKQFELELVDRHKLPNLRKSAYAKIRFKNITEEYFTIQLPQVCVVVSFSATSENIDHYRRVMFEIVDSIELRSQIAN